MFFKEKGDFIMKKYLANAFSINMLPEGKDVTVSIVNISKNDIPRDIISAIGHVDTAAVISSELGFQVPAQRITVSLDESDILYVAQYIGPRLTEGTTTLPKGSKIRYMKVTYDIV